MDVSPEEFVRRLVSEETHLEPCDEGSEKLQLPPWFDERLFKIGQSFFLYNLFGQVGAMVAGLISAISVPTTLDVMVHTKSSSTPCTAYFRYLPTLLHGLAWVKHDLKPGSLSWKSITYVRSKHLKVHKSAKSCSKGTISQRDLALTQFGMIGYTFTNPDLFGIRSNEKDSYEGYAHMWRTLCYMIGLKDKYNLCLGTADETRQICLILREQVFSHLLEYPPEPFEHMSHAALDGLWTVLPLNQPKHAMYMVRYAAGVPGYVLTEADLIECRDNIRNGKFKNLPKSMLAKWPTPTPRPELNIDDFYLLSTVPAYKKLNSLEKFTLHLNISLVALYSTQIGRYLINTFVNFMIKVAEIFPILALVRFGFQSYSVNLFSGLKIDCTVPRSNAEMSIYNMQPWYTKYNPFK